MKISPLSKFLVGKGMIIPVVRISALVILFQLFNYLGLAQTAANPYPAVNVMSPNASSLGKYVDYPVNMHTGVPDIQIPLYTIQEGTLALPVGLSYHAAGLRVLELASSVGAGWALNAGGVISRTVKGLPDEKIEYSGYSFFSHYGYSNYFMDEANKTDYRALLLGHKDGEPDLFFFNFAGYSGKFHFREDKTPVLIPESDLKIEPYFKSPTNTYSTLDYIQGFIITVPDGTRYYFGVTTDNTTDVDPIEKGVLYNADDQLAVWDQVISSWYLYKVESADGRYKIDLTYRAERYGYHTIATAPCIPDCNKSISLFKTVVFGVVLDQINSSNGRISFIPSANLREDVNHYNTSIVESANTEARALAEIKIESKVSSHCTSFKFSHDYFRSNGALPAKIAFYGTFNSDKNRLKLNLIQEFQCNSSVAKPAYVFNYYDASSVPRRLSFAQDHWGFNNGAETNKNLLPQLDANTGYGGDPSEYDNREAAWPQMRAGTLRSIQYPTGGGTEFVLEPNEATTYHCKFEKQENAMYNVSAGLTGPDGGFGSPFTLTVTTPRMYYYRVTTVGSGSGSLYIDNTSIGSTNGVSEDYFFLNPGTYTVRAYANADNGSGVGVLAFIHLTNSTCVEIPKMVGGLRVKQIEQFGIEPTARVLKAYKYDKSYLYSVPVYIFKLRHELVTAGIVPNGTEEGCKKDGAYVEYYSSPVSTQPMQTTQGYHIGYSSVREVFPDGGYTINEFRGGLVLPAGWYTLEDVSVRKIDATKCLKSDPLYPAVPPPHDFERGNLKSRTVYDKDNRKLFETSYDEEYVDDAIGVFGVITKSYAGGPTTLPRHYDIRSAKLLWKKKIDRVFNPANVLEYVETQQTTEFSSPYHNLATREIQTTSDGTGEKKYTYVPDLTTCDDVCPQCATDYNAAAVTLRTTYENNVQDCSFGANCTSFVGCSDNYNPCSVLRDCKVCAWTDYQYRLNELRKQYTTCIRNCTNNNNNCLTDGKASAHAGISKVYLLEDKNQIADPVETSVWKNSKLLKSTFFDFEIIDNNTSDIRLKRAYTTALESPATALTTVAFGTEELVKDPQYSNVPEVTYAYEVGRIAELKGRDGVVTSYLWGYANTVPIVKAVGIDHTTLKTAYTADPVNIRTHSAVANAQVTTYQHDPVLGVIAITDPNGKQQTFDYDVLGRLLRIKDHEGKVVEQYEYRYQVQ